MRCNYGAWNIDWIYRFIKDFIPGKITKMKNLLKILTSLLLLFNGIGAIYGGGNLIFYRAGSTLHLSAGILQHTPFQNFLIPGIALFIINGLCSLCVFAALVLNFKKAALLVFIQGILLVTWIAVQVVLIYDIYLLHVVMFVTGVALIINGFFLKKSCIMVSTGKQNHSTP